MKDVIKMLSLNNKNQCPLCLENPSEVLYMHPQVCRYCDIFGGQLSIGSRGGSKESLLRQISTYKVADPSPRTTEYLIHVGREETWEVLELGYLGRLDRMLLPKKYTKLDKYFLTA